MCLITQQKEPTILTEDLTVYKDCIRVNIFTAKAVLQNFVYTRGKTEETVMEYEKGFVFPFDLVVSSFYAKYDKPEYEESESESLISVNVGFHFALYPGRFEKKHPFLATQLAEFFVPKGSKVYFDETGLGVSDKIKFVNWVE
jgi:hypothetical protein